MRNWEGQAIVARSCAWVGAWLTGPHYSRLLAGVASCRICVLICLRAMPSLFLLRLPLPAWPCLTRNTITSQGHAGASTDAHTFCPSSSPPYPAAAACSTTVWPSLSPRLSWRRASLVRLDTRSQSKQQRGFQMKGSRERIRDMQHDERRRPGKPLLARCWNGWPSHEPQTVAGDARSQKGLARIIT